MLTLEEKTKVNMSKRNSHCVRPESEYISSPLPGSFRWSTETQNFPKNEFYAFQRQKAEHFVFESLTRAYFEKQISSFYLIWDNLQYSKLLGMLVIVQRREASQLAEVFNLVRLKNSINPNGNRLLALKPFLERRRQKMAKKSARAFKMQSFEQKYKMNRTFSVLNLPNRTSLERISNLQSKLKAVKKSKNTWDSGSKFSNSLFPGQLKKREKNKRMRKVASFAFKKTNNTFKLSKGFKPQIQEGAALQEMEMLNPKNMFSTLNLSGSRRVEEESILGPLSSEPYQLLQIEDPKEPSPYSQRSVETKKVDPKFLKTCFVYFSSFKKEYLANGFTKEMKLLLFKHDLHDFKIILFFSHFLENLNLDQFSQQRGRKRESAFTSKAFADFEESLYNSLKKANLFQKTSIVKRVIDIHRASKLFQVLRNKVNWHSTQFMSRTKLLCHKKALSKLSLFIDNTRLAQKKETFSKIAIYVKPNLKLLLLMFVISKVKQKKVMVSFRRLYGFYLNRMIKRSDESFQSVERETIKRKKRNTWNPSVGGGLGHGPKPNWRYSQLDSDDESFITVLKEKQVESPDILSEVIDFPDTVIPFDGHFKKKKQSVETPILIKRKKGR